MKKPASKISISQLNQRKCIPHLPRVAQTTPQYIIKPLNQASATYLTIVFRTCSQYSSDKYVLDLLENILGGYFSSKLYILLREHNGLTYSSSTDTQYYENLGDFKMSAITDHTKLIRNGKQKGVLPLIIDMINQLIKNGVSDEELILVKNYIKGNRIMAMKDTKKACFHNAEYMLLYSNTNEYVPYKNVYDAYYKTITREQIHSIIRKYFKKENMTVFIAGQYTPSLATIQKECEKIVA
jgi:predicted Zn-dependent peptidase